MAARQTHERSDWRPKVTALVPCYNSAAFISLTLDSLAAQTWDNLEILVGEDNSTDETFELVSAFARSRGDVRILRRSHNLGWLRNSNDLMANATGELMFFAFHDDVIDPTYVESLVRALNDNPGAVLSYSDVEVTEVSGETAVCSFDRLSGLQDSLARGLVMAAQPPGWWVPNRGLFRAWAFHRSGGIKPNSQGEYSADWTWLLHLSLLGTFVRVPEILCHKYYRSGSISKVWDRSRAQQRALRVAGIREVWRSEVSLSKKTILVVYMALRRPRLLRWLRTTKQWLNAQWVHRSPE
ncbi:glycosyltransferase [Phenylobacterium sp. LH3H17]|uniref:glycosyltransferase family 2 protein n=1 Tax=Phenylobacterium sp. LH3H17 TaxID=2903901 RepID=UPI0020C9AAC4|nr:glycosyltransferase [Phenylobacterium sp. LH3H17]UTP38023.1 glycosyltransferase [Phenylobacterium sp. LH3H17]